MLSIAQTAEDCASASTIKTPGMIGWSGKWPLKNQSESSNLPSRMHCPRIVKVCLNVGLGKGQSCMFLYCFGYASKKSKNAGTEEIESFGICLLPAIFCIFQNKSNLLWNLVAIYQWKLTSRLVKTLVKCKLFDSCFDARKFENSRAAWLACISALLWCPAYCGCPLLIFSLVVRASYCAFDVLLLGCLFRSWHIQKSSFMHRRYGLLR